MKTIKNTLARAVIALFLFAMQATATAGEYETSVSRKASDLLPADLLGSKLYKIDDFVTNDGFLNHYMVNSNWGKWQISSNAILHTRLTEIVAMTEMQKVLIEDSMGGAIEDDIEDIGTGFNALVTDPKGAAEGAVSGVKKMFSLAGESWRSRDTRKDESAMTNIGNTVSGFSKAKREFAAEFGVDPYSSNKDLHDELDRIARAASGGVMIGMVAKALIPGGIGVLVSATDMSHSLNKLLTTRSEVELRIINRDKLTKIGMDAVLIETFIDDPLSSTSYKTYIVGALESMSGVKGRDKYLEFAIAPPSEDVAFYRMQSALMYAAYHTNKNKLLNFLPSGPTMAAIDHENTLVVQAAVDHLLWTEPLATLVKSLDKQATVTEKLRGKRLSISGTVSKQALSELHSRGWEIRQEVTRK